jgi:type IV pilus biogenesis protein CpaD/CtpE
MHVRLARTVKVALLAVSFAALSGCADMNPMQAQIDDLRLELDQLKKATETSTKMANTAAANASAAGVEEAIRDVQLATQDNAEAITALSDKLDRMFKRPLAKQAATEQ